MGAPTKEQAADYLTWLADMDMNGTKGTLVIVFMPRIEDMRLIFLARKSVGLMATWKGKSESGRAEHRKQEALLGRILDNCIDGDKMRDDATIVIDPGHASLLSAAARALVEYEIKEKSERHR